MRALAALAALVLWAAASGGCGGAPLPPLVSSASRLLGRDLPAFRRPTVQGGSVDTASSAGRVRVIDFFADYCRPCQRALPGLEAFHRRHPEVEVIGVSLDADEATARRSIGRHHLTFPVVHDAGNVLAGRFRVSELPHAFVADGRGQVRFVAGPEQPRDAATRAALALPDGS